MFSAYNRANYIKKEFLYEIYCFLVPKAKDYDKITRKKMIEEILTFYTEYKEEILNLLTDKELEFLFSLDSNKTYKDSFYSDKSMFNYFLLSYEKDSYTNFSITKELVEIISELKTIYLSNKKEIEKRKESSYFIVGLLRTYGALSLDEVIYICDKLELQSEKISLSIYTGRFLGLNPSSQKPSLCLSELYDYAEDILSSHPKNIRVKYSYEQILSIGKNYFMTDNPEYKRLFSYPKLLSFFNNINKNELIIWRGAGLCTKWFKIKIESFIEILNEEEKACFFTFLDFMPSYILEKNDKNILSEEDGNLFYEVFLPFLEYAAEFYDLEFDHYEKSYNPQHAYLIFEKCSENKFRVVDNFINDTRNISSEHKQILNGLKRAKKGAFIIYKHTKDGSIFIDEKSLYLVKGVQSNLENMEYIKETPCACMTILIPFKKQITYCGILTPMGTLGPNLKKQYNEFYKKNKNKLLKTL